VRQHPDGSMCLGTYLRERRARLDPAALGLAKGRRRTPGLRREEVAQRAHISPTWYTWLEQGRGGPPSAEVLDRLARALMLTETEREHLFLLGLNRRPEVLLRDGGGVTLRLQRVLDALDPVPAIIRGLSWDVLAWNRGATVMLADYGALAASERNILRILFLDPRARAMQPDWPAVARHVVGAFRIEAARAGAEAQMRPLVEELCARSELFRELWKVSEVSEPPGEIVKTLHHPLLGTVEFEYSVFAVEGRPDLALVVYQPLTEAVRTRLGAIVGGSSDLVD
jgi:transcriptional regulator with XRE-family HTH domain